VRMIYSDYLSGLGRNAIMKKLIRLGIPTKCGGRWTEYRIRYFLTNEKYIGDTCLQKGYVTDHVTKNRKVNRGELSKFYVEGSHEAIIDRVTFEAVQEEMARRVARVNTSSKIKASSLMNSLKKTVRAHSEFTGMIHCGRCGANFQRKINNIGTPYAQVNWACATYTYHGKQMCGAKRIREDVLKVKCAEVLGLTEYNPDVFSAKVASISVPDDGVLVFTVKDGTEQMVLWEYPSRRDSWTDEMRAVAKKKRECENL